MQIPSRSIKNINKKENLNNKLDDAFREFPLGSDSDDEDESESDYD